ncbi:hypothetical protein V493_06931 [Pseudogymnoascus sp. VKM F-4281 (FW-2241)]|nr:hypothetical protein V493_06931 [Pseudogymnoascus sp. VKM F-4281 (FW-2241)]
MGNSQGGMVKRPSYRSTHSPDQAESEGDCDVVVDMEHPTGTVPSVCDLPMRHHGGACEWKERSRTVGVSGPATKVHARYVRVRKNGTARCEEQLDQSQGRSRAGEREEKKGRRREGTRKTGRLRRLLTGLLSAVHARTAAVGVEPQSMRTEAHREVAGKRFRCPGPHWQSEERRYADTREEQNHSHVAAWGGAGAGSSLQGTAIDPWPTSHRHHAMVVWRRRVAQWPSEGTHCLLAWDSESVAADQWRAATADGQRSHSRSRRAEAGATSK